MGIWWRECLDRPADLGSASALEAQLIISARIAVFAHRTGADPKAHIAARLGSHAMSNQLALVIIAIGQAWPEPFSVAPPCCSRLSPDEAMLVAMIGSAMRGNRALFDRQTCEMLAEDARSLIYNLLCQLGRLARA